MYRVSRKKNRQRGGALVLAMSVVFVTLSLGSALLSLSTHAFRRGHHDALRERALRASEAGVDRVIHYLRNTAPDGTKTGTWRTSTPLREELDSATAFEVTAENGTGDNGGKVVITSTGIATQSGLVQRKRIRVVMKLDLENVSVWNNVIFGGVGQASRSINGNIVMNGSVHLLGDGEKFTDVDGDTRWDNNETYIDLNHNGAWEAGEPFTDTDGDGRRDAREPFDDVNGNGTRDPALTVTDMASEISGTATVGNNYNGMSSTMRSLIPNPATEGFGTETVESLKAKLRVKHGRVNISGSATVGDPNVTGGSPAVKETVNGAYVSDGFGGNQGASQVYADNGTKRKYDLGEIVQFPALTDPVTIGSTTYPSHMNYLQSAGLNISGSKSFTKGTEYGPWSDAKGNSLYIDTSGVIHITGIVVIDGDLALNRNGGDKRFYYSGRGTLVTTGTADVHTDLLPAGSFPVTHALGFVARRELKLATGSGDSQLTMLGAFYAQEKITSIKQNEIGGSFVTSYFAMQNVPHMYQVPELANNLPPGMPGAQSIWVKTVRIDSWREVAPQ